MFFRVALLLSLMDSTEDRVDVRQNTLRGLVGRGRLRSDYGVRLERPPRLLLGKMAETYPALLRYHELRHPAGLVQGRDGLVDRHSASDWKRLWDWRLHLDGVGDQCLVCLCNLVVLELRGAAGSRLAVLVCRHAL